MMAQMSQTLFNNVLRALVKDLSRAFPKDDGIARIYNKCGRLLSLSPGLPLDHFNKTLGTRPEKIAARDDTIFQDFPELAGLDLRSIWQRATLDNRRVIWEYLDQMVSACTMEQHMPPVLKSQADIAAATLRGAGTDVGALMDSMMQSPAMQALLGSRL